MVQADFNHDPYIKEFGLEVSHSMMETLGRVLNPPKLEYGARNSRTFTGLLPSVGGCQDFQAYATSAASI